MYKILIKHECVLLENIQISYLCFALFNQIITVLRTRPFNPVSMQHAAATNNVAAAITYVSGVQAALDKM